MDRKALFYDNSRSNARNAPRILAVCDCACDVATTEEELARYLSRETYDLIIYPIEALKLVAPFAKKLQQVPCILLSQAKIKDLHPYIQKPCPTNILAKTPEGHLKARELIATIKKIFEFDIFGVHHYVNTGTKSEVYHIRDSRERDAYIHTVSEFCKRMYVRTSTIQAVELFCEELLMNAIYDAPRDASGGELYGHTSRRDRVVLKPKDAARMEFACDGEKLVISVSDPFGAITWETVQAYLAKCFSQDRRITNLDEDGGAGLGLYLCFNAVNSFIVNVKPKVRSEFIGIFELEGSARQRYHKYSSLHFFTTKTADTGDRPLILPHSSSTRQAS